MFALEISFQDGVSQSLMILVRHPKFVIGASEKGSHVVVEDMRDLDYQICLTKKIGRTFTCQAIPLNPGADVPIFCDGPVDGTITLDLGNVQLTAISLDGDLAVHAGEPPDRAGVRILRQACANPSPEYPAIVIAGDDPVVISFSPEQPIYIGRSNKCAVRLGADEVSSKHARMGYENGSFWIEDLGSTNGTFVNAQQISGRVSVDPDTPITLGNKEVIFGVTTPSELAQIIKQGDTQAVPQPTMRRYPVLLSLSEVARPARLVLPVGSSVSIGRDPTSDMWLGAPHVSRRHCEITLSQAGITTVEDFSTNGTSYGTGILKKGRLLEFEGEPKVLNFGGNLTVAICFNEEEEQRFIDSKGSSRTFITNNAAPEAEHIPEPKRAKKSLVAMETNVHSMPQMNYANVNYNNSKKGFSWNAEGLKEYYFSLPLYKQILYIIIAVILQILLIVFIRILWGLF